MKSRDMPRVFLHPSQQVALSTASSVTMPSSFGALFSAAFPGGQGGIDLIRGKESVGALVPSRPSRLPPPLGLLAPAARGADDLAAQDRGRHQRPRLQAGRWGILVVDAEDRPDRLRAQRRPPVRAGVGDQALLLRRRPGRLRAGPQVRDAGLPPRRGEGRPAARRPDPRGPGRPDARRPHRRRRQAGLQGPRPHLRQLPQRQRVRGHRHRPARRPRRRWPGRSRRPASSASTARC